MWLVGISDTSRDVSLGYPSERGNLETPPLRVPDPPSSRTGSVPSLFLRSPESTWRPRVVNPSPSLPPLPSPFRAGLGAVARQRAGRTGEGRNPCAPRASFSLYLPDNQRLVGLRRVPRPQGVRRSLTLSSFSPFLLPIPRSERRWIHASDFRRGAGTFTRSVSQKEVVAC